MASPASLSHSHRCHSGALINYCPSGPHYLRPLPEPPSNPYRAKLRGSRKPSSKARVARLPQRSVVGKRAQQLRRLQPDLQSACPPRPTAPPICPPAPPSCPPAPPPVCLPRSSAEVSGPAHLIRREWPGFLCPPHPPGLLRCPERPRGYSRSLTPRRLTRRSQSAVSGGPAPAALRVSRAGAALCFPGRAGARRCGLSPPRSERGSVHRPWPGRRARNPTSSGPGSCRGWAGRSFPVEASPREEGGSRGLLALALRPPRCALRVPVV